MQTQDAVERGSVPGPANHRRRTPLGRLKSRRRVAFLWTPDGGSDARPWEYSRGASEQTNPKIRASDKVSPNAACASVHARPSGRGRWLLPLAEELFRRTAELPLFAEFAGDLASDEAGAHGGKEHEKDKQNQERPGESPGEKDDPDGQRNQGDEKVRQNVPPGESLRRPLVSGFAGEEPGTQPAFSESAAFAIVVAGSTASGQEPGFHPDAVAGVQYGPDDSDADHDVQADRVDGQALGVADRDHPPRKVLE